MKRLLWIMLSVSLNCVGLHCKVAKKNTQLCLNTPPDFGKRHFIVGYKEQGAPAQTVIEGAELPAVKEKKKHKRASHKKEEHVRGGAEVIDKNCKMQSFFTSIHDLADILMSVISEAQKSLCIAAFTLTEPRIADLLIEKHKKGVDVCVIVDAGNMKQAHSKVHNLIDNNISVWRYDPALNVECKKNGLFEPLMHHKFITIDNDIVVTGSANLTKAAHKYNRENIVIVRDMQLAHDYHAECERLKKYCIKCKSNKSYFAKASNETE